MKSLLQIVFVLSLIFASTFVLMRLLNLFELQDIEGWLENAHEIDATYLFILVIVLLSIDLFIAIPTLSVSVLAGYFLGFVQGGIAAFIGLLCAGIIGYSMSYIFGDRILRFIIRNESKRNEAIGSFNKYGLAMLLLSRSSPILPEVSACMAGITRMPFLRFSLTWIAGALPYAFVATYAGSIGSLENPKPAIYIILGLYAFLWSSWFLYTNRNWVRVKIAGHDFIK